jgi:hypothetical protein
VHRRISCENGREGNEDCKVVDSSSRKSDHKRDASQINVHSLSSEPEHNQLNLRRKLNCTEGEDSHSFVLTLQTKC